MKKFFAALIAATMMLSLAACGKSGIEDGWADEDVEVTELEDGTKLYEAKLGSKLKTSWFDLTINNAYITEEALEGYTPADGCALLVVEMTLKNTFEESVPMWDEDFWVDWGTDDEGTYPVRTSEDLTDDQFPAEYNLAVKEEKTGTLVFEVPADETDLCINFVEYFDNDTTGNWYAVYFTPDKK